MRPSLLRVALSSALLLLVASGCGEEPAVCGDGVLAAGEECDDGNEVDTDACYQCRDARCGDGVVLPGTEACDDGNTNETDACRFDCTLPQCGDGIKQQGEACDGAAFGGETCNSRGFGAGELACAANCAAVITSGCCGDGQIGNGELCDGPAVGTATCEGQDLGSGTLSCNATCDGFNTTGCCGDGTAASTETCDGTDLKDQTCESQGFTGGGTLACSADACNAFDTSNCCGDNVAGSAEVCDGTDFKGAVCASGVGTLSCNASCSAVDETNCCGDGTAGSAEVCDTIDLKGATCQSLGFAPGGALTCSNNGACNALNTSNCCGDGVAGSAETCDGTDFKGQTCEDMGFRSGVLGCGSCGTVLTAGCCGDGHVGGGEECDDGNAVDSDSCSNACTQPVGATPQITVCRAVPPSDAVCDVTAGSGAKLITGTILLPGEILRGGQVAISTTGQITCVGCDCAASQPGATEIVCPQGVVSPGMINAHDHITYAHNPPIPTSERYEHRHDWRSGLREHTQINYLSGASTQQVQFGELRYVLSGATSVIGSGTAVGFMRNLDRAAGLEGLAKTPVHYETFPLHEGSTFRDGNCDYGSTPDTASFVNSTSAYFPHVSEGIDREARNEFFCTAIPSFDNIGSPPVNVANDLLQTKTAVIHGVAFAPPDFGELGFENGSLVWSPRSNVSLYGDTARVNVAHRMGVNVALGTDWMPSGSMNMFRELKCADDWNRERMGGYFTDEQLWLMTTRNAAMAAKMDDVLGVLAVGRVADLAIYDARERYDHRAILSGDVSDVALVMRGGKPLTGDAEVIAALTGNTSCELVPVCGVDKRICVQSETGVSYNTLFAAGSTRYGLFYCGEPPNEPTCSPNRPESVNGSTVYTGAITSEDLDGDGIANGSDNCPGAFNPIRPQEGGAQADFDGDGEGDACDVCPMDPDATVCSAFSAADRDSDGTPDATDNCAFVPNVDQSDQDADGKGDVCDVCPTRSNPGTQGCPVSIYELKNGSIPQGTTVRLSNVLVTARHQNGFFIQVKETDGEYLGPNHSGIFVFHTQPTVNAGDRLDITSAQFGSFFGQFQLSAATFSPVSTGEPGPAPVIVLPSEVETGGPKSDLLEGVVVQVQDVKVTSITPPPSSGESLPTFEYLVDGSGLGADALRVDDLFYRTAPFPVVGERYSSITGVLVLRVGDTRLEPRDAGDVVVGPPALVGFGPALSYSRDGYVAMPTIPEPLTVTLSRPATSPTFISIVSSHPDSLSVPGDGVVIPAGNSSAIVQLDGEEAHSGVTLTATLGLDTLEATVRVLEPDEPATLTSIAPSPVFIAPGGVLELQVSLDVPAPPGGVVINLSVAPSNAGTLPATVTIPQDAQTATFEYTDTSGVAATVSATDGINTVSAELTIYGGPRHVVINEVDYDSVGGDNAEYIELYNPMPSPLPLTDLAVVFINGNGNAEYSRFSLASFGSIAPGQYLVIGGEAVSTPGGVLRLNFPADNAIQNGEPDGVALINTATLTIVDALSYDNLATAGMTSVTITGFPGPQSLVEGTVLAGSVADSNSVQGSLIREPNGNDTDQANADWKFTTTPTPGTANVFSAPSSPLRAENSDEL